MRRQNERMEAFTSTVSHDLRNPLSVARGYLDTVETEADNDSLLYVDEAHERMEEIIEQLLVLAQDGKRIDELEPVSLAVVAERAWENVPTTSATLSIDFAGLVEADPITLQHVFENLFRNAVEHGSTSPRSQTPEDAVEHGSTSHAEPDGSADAVEHGGTDVHVTVGELADGFSVEDDGPGIPNRDRKSVLEAGYTTAAEGTGFGLQIVGSVVDAHGWTLTVTEGSAGGARFEITGVDRCQTDD
ncbi:sensor histidine kinase [Natrarchaeobius sp. A-rgal3]|uniref:sensor histidine kinase n=1 Tax=Natrarchaeobius versutus TaxID=1679078 RepID=UPI0035102101